MVSSRILETYGSVALAEKLLQSLAAAGCDLTALTTDDLIVFDELHIMGRRATVELGRQAGVTATTTVLDLGCGVGGPARTLAENFGCRVTGVDLSASFVAAATALTVGVGLDRLVSFVVGQALALPFPDSRFDIVFMQHLTPNIVDKAALLGEARRVLAPGGRLALWEVCRGNGLIVYPVPWANDAAFSHVPAMQELLGSLHAAGFVAVEWEDATAAAADWVAKRVAAGGRKSTGRRMIDLNLILPEFRHKRVNISDNLLRGTIKVLRAVAVAPPVQ